MNFLQATTYNHLPWVSVKNTGLIIDRKLFDNYNQKDD